MNMCRNGFGPIVTIVSWLLEPIVNRLHMIIVRISLAGKRFPKARAYSISPTHAHDRYL